MKKLSHQFLMQLLSAVISLLLYTRVPGQSVKPAKTGYAPVNGLNIYYEIYGEGKPLVLLHGSFMTINTNYGQLIPELAKTRKVIAVEFQGHGRTADIDRPISLEALADDVAGVIRHLKMDSADILGYSLGGSVAMQVAIRHPQLVRKLVIVSAVFKQAGWSAETRAIFPMIKPEFFEGTPMKLEYDSIAPNPKNWAVMMNKVLKMVNTGLDFTARAKTVKKPVFLIFGDSDGVLPEHIAEMYRIAGGGQNGDLSGTPNSRLAILPATAHTTIFMHNDWLAGSVPQFLDAPVK